MLRFFRSIRQQLLAENKTVKYLKYALGEFLLIVAGILVALQIQNWNEERKNQLRIQSHLEELRSEFLFDLEQLEQLWTGLDEAEKGAFEIVNFLTEEGVEVDEESLKRAIFSAGLMAVYSPSKVAYENLVFSGGIEHLKNNKLKRLLGAFHNPNDWDWTYYNGPMMANYQKFLSLRHQFVELLLHRNQYLSMFKEYMNLDPGETMA